MIRFFDIMLSMFGLVFLLPLIIVIWLLCWLDNQAPIFCQERLGRYQKPFVLVKFRTMHPKTESVVTHLVDMSAVTIFGRFLRRTKLDELPQLWNVLSGDMSLVGPRPGLSTQYELTLTREKRGVFSVRPGITGLAQISKIDMSTPELLARTDAQMIAEMSVCSYFKYIFFTLIGNGFGDRIKP